MHRKWGTVRRVAGRQRLNRGKETSRNVSGEQEKEIVKSKTIDNKNLIYVWGAGMVRAREKWKRKENRSIRECATLCSWDVVVVVLQIRWFVSNGDETHAIATAAYRAQSTHTHTRHTSKWQNNQFQLKIHVKLYVRARARAHVKHVFFCQHLIDDWFLGCLAVATATAFDTVSLFFFFFCF